MNNDEILKILKNFLDIEDINIDKIPNIDLYMDQVTRFIEDSLKNYKRNEEQKIITKTMINNYTKDKILSPPTKKKYNKKHIISLILIYYLKSIISINDIGLILKNAEENIEEVYDKLIHYKKVSNDLFYSNIEKLLEDINSEKNKDIALILFLINVINEANQRKLLAEKIIDLYFKK